LWLQKCWQGVRSEETSLRVDDSDDSLAEDKTRSVNVLMKSPEVAIIDGKINIDERSACSVVIPKDSPKVVSSPTNMVLIISLPSRRSSMHS
jgi:hypothetical protein